MAVTVRFFASLRERLGRDEVQVEASTAEQAWQLASGEASLPANVLVAVNMAYVDPAQALEEGDEVAFFPPVTGG